MCIRDRNVAAHGHDHGDEIAAHTHEPHRHHKHRGMNEIRQILADTKMTDSARGIALKIFQILARAEAKAHNVPVEEVHFHEVGAVDSIVDILSVAVCLDTLGITEDVYKRQVFRLCTISACTGNFRTGR